ncbi:Outer membrane protein assembly factor BamB [Planctomycetes bacterium LzC2]|uniref:Outer membrane protein assembly factor BamB n=1 Tax=Alienimonas chondri TaxID=2681879 RepID=A0ABX1VBI7_9PLAN|nr:Outer membrane protein assembly factor BamB [Alienimonas chondri]
MPRWTTPIIADAGEREEFREAVDRLQRSDAALLPVWEPLTVTVGGRHLTLARTTAGVVATDAETGEIQWRSRESGLAVRGAKPRILYYSSRNTQNEAEQNDTISAVYREASFGKLSTDGVRVFLLEADEETPGVPTNYSGRILGEVGRPVRLVAYRIETGRLDWEIGGTFRDEPFDLPLAGWRPLGAPVVDGGDLFLVAERVAAEGLRQINLFCLDPATGRPRWNRNVAAAESTITTDPVRAEWGAWCAVSNGVIVVPTTVGWVAGIDRLTREVLWVERVYEPEVGNLEGQRIWRGGAVISASPRDGLADYWRPGPPLVLDNRVVLAPPGEDRLYALDLMTGERLWRPRRRRDWKAMTALLPPALFEATGKTEDGALVLVGPNGLAAVSLTDGSTRVWTYTLPPELGRPSGMPLVAGDRLLLPVSGGALVSVDAVTGKDAEVSWRTDAGGPARGLGALGVSAGRLISVGPSGFVGFEDRAGLAADLAAAAEAPESQDALLMLREAELLRTGGETAKVLAKLDAIHGDGSAGRETPAGLSPADAERYRALLRGTLRDAILGFPEGPLPEPDRQDELLDRLSALADTPARVIAADRLRADRLRSRGEPAKAVTALWELMGARLDEGAVPDDNPLVPAAGDDEPPPPAAEPVAPEPDAEVRLSRAVSRQLRGIWEAGGADHATDVEKAGREAVDDLAADLMSDADGVSGPSSPAAELLSFHPAVAEGLLTWAENALGSRETAAAGELTLIRLADARGDSVGERAEKALGSLREAPPESAGDSLRSVVAEAVPGDSQITPPTLLPAPATLRPFFQSHVLAVSTDGARLDVLDAGAPGGRTTVAARFPLLGQVTSSTVQQFNQIRGLVQMGLSTSYRRPTGRMAVGSAGGVIFPVTRGAVGAVHPETGITLWNRPVEGAAPYSSGKLALGVPASSEEAPQIMQRAARWARSGDQRPRSGVVAANAEIVVVLDDRTLTALDALTGETIWLRRRLEPQNATAIATSTAVIVAPGNSASPPGLALAARDGFPLPTAERALDVVTKALAVAGAGIVHVFEGPGGGYFFTSWDPGDDRPLWTRGVNGEAKLIVLPGAGVPIGVIVSPDGPDDDDEEEGLLVDLRTGASVTLGGVNTGGASLAAIADADRVLIAARPTRGTSRRYSINRLSTLTVGGTIDVFDRDGGRLWRTDGSGSELLWDGLDRASFVTLLTAETDAGRGELTEVELVALDKQTGRELMRALVPVLDELEESAVTPAGDVLHLWNNNNQLQEHWRMRLTEAGDRVAPEADAADGTPTDDAATGEAADARPVNPSLRRDAGEVRRDRSPEALRREALRVQALDRVEQLLDRERANGDRTELQMQQIEQLRERMRDQLERRPPR